MVAALVRFSVLFSAFIQSLNVGNKTDSCLDKVCIRCHGKGKTCDYSHNDSLDRRAKSKTPARRPQPIRSRAFISLPATAPTPTASPDSHLTRQARSLQTPSATEPSAASPIHEQSQSYYTAHGRFAGQVARAIETRGGFHNTSKLVPFVDAPLFGDIGEQHPSAVLDFATELPRPYADKLVSIYWKHIHPVEPILDQQRFYRDYDAYSRPVALIHPDREIWLSTLNVIFALAVQIQESIPMQERDCEGNRYFQRAWALLRPEAILWKPGSLELVQCLMLMNRYLHCTNNQQKSWMTAGLAIRIAQNMCHSTPEMNSANDCDNQLKRKVWASCVALERYFQTAQRYRQ